MSKIFTCDCGFQWKQGRNGDHQCGPFYMEKIAALEKQNAELLAAAIQAEKAIDILWVSHHANRADAALEVLRSAIGAIQPSTQEVSK